MNKNIKQHLIANRMHYGHAIFRALDSIQIALLLSGYGYKLGDSRMVPVSQVVEPRPIRYVGNYLAFKTNISADSEEDFDPAWDKFIKDRKIVVNKVKNEIVPLGSGGVFAEAVLGRSNCAEVFDATRFWDLEASTSQFKQNGRFSKVLTRYRTRQSLSSPLRSRLSRREVGR